jgi:CheY-like chemotaxis protein
MKSILCVDDEPWTISVELQLLEAHGFATKLVSSVTSALLALDKKRDYDLIVIDVINRACELGEPMDSRIPQDSPKTMGLVLARLVRESLRISTTPLVFYTVVNEGDDIDRRMKELAAPCFYLSKRDSLAQLVMQRFGTEE